MKLKPYLLVCAILSLSIHALLMEARAGGSISRTDGSVLISTPFPVRTADRSWHWTSTDEDGFRHPPEQSLRPTEPPAVRPLIGENVTAISLYLDNDYAAADAITIIGGLQNTGASTLNEIVVRFFLGDPENDGMQIGQDRIIASLAPGSTAYDSVSWSGFTGQSQIYCVVDPDQAIAEEDETDNTDSLMVGMVDGVPWVWQEVNGYCHYAGQTMLFNFHGADNTVYETLELASCPYSICYQDGWLNLLGGWGVCQGFSDIEYAGQLRNLSADWEIEPSWSYYLMQLRQWINAGVPFETSVDPYWLPQPDYDICRTYGLHSGHAVVVVGYTDDAIVFNDPGVGLDFILEPPIPNPENRGANVIVHMDAFRNAVESTWGTSYILVSYSPAGPMPTHEEMLQNALGRSMDRLDGYADVYESGLLTIYDVFGASCFSALMNDATATTFQEVFEETMSQTAGDLLSALDILATNLDLWGCGICWNAAAVFYGAQSYPQASRLSDLSAQLSAKGDEAWGEYVDLLEAVYNNGGNTSIAGPYLSRLQSILDEITPLEDSVLVQLNGLYGFLTEVENGDVSGRLPTEAELSCYPNPFNEGTVIRYTLHVDAPVGLAVYNILGQKVCHLADGHQLAGTHQVVWDGRDDGGREMASGIYFCRMEGEAAVRTVKMVLLR